MAGLAAQRRDRPQAAFVGIRWSAAVNRRHRFRPCGASMPGLSATCAAWSLLPERAAHMSTRRTRGGVSRDLPCDGLIAADAVDLTGAGSARDRLRLHAGRMGADRHGRGAGVSVVGVAWRVAVRDDDG